jgi:hypothetical protein
MERIMKVLEFHFTQLWNMEAACGDDVTDSDNPAPVTAPGIYIIHNANEATAEKSTTYVGYAKNARDRWGGRYETLHCLGIPGTYGKRIFCGFCIPTLDGINCWNLVGAQACEHALMRAVYAGLLGKTMNTNTSLINTPFVPACDLEIRVYFQHVPRNGKWGHLENEKFVRIKQGTGY